jgi:hypothetical protein
VRNAIVIAALMSMPSWTASETPEAPEHAALRLLRGHLLDSINKMDIDGILEDLHPNVVVTWHNAEVSRGRQGVREYLNRMTGGPNPFVKSFKADVNVDELTALYGGSTGIAFGSSNEQFKLATGLDFTLHGRWTATLIRVNGKWLVASLHASTNLFDNPLLNLAKRSLYIGVGISSVIALAIGLLLGRKLWKQRS